MMFRRRKSSKKINNSKKAGTATAKEIPEVLVSNDPIPEQVSEQEQQQQKEEQDPWSEDNFAAMAEQYNLTPQQQDAMKEMQQRLVDIDHWKNDPFEVIRFLKESKYNLKTAETKFRKMMNWRLENNIDNFLETYGEPHPLFDYYPSVILKGQDKDGDPIFVERPGKYDAWGFYKEFGTQEMVDYIVWKRERDITRARGPIDQENKNDWQRNYYEPTYGRRVGQFTAIMDVEGLNRNHMRAGLLPLLNQVARLTQDYYAGVAKRIIVLRAPAIFKVFWGIVKNFFDPCIREIVIFTTPNDYLDVLEQYLDRSVLPEELDPEQGQGTFMDGFENVQFQGGFVTKELIEQCGGGGGTANKNKNKLGNNLSSSFDHGSVTETTELYSGSSMLGTDDEEGSLSPSQDSSYGVSEGVTVVSGLLGGGSYRGKAIYLRGTSGN